MNSLAGRHSEVPRVQGTQENIGLTLLSPGQVGKALSAREFTPSFQNRCVSRALPVSEARRRQLIHSRLLRPLCGQRVRDLVPIMDCRQRLPVLGGAD